MSVTAFILPDDRYRDLGLPAGAVVWLDDAMAPRLGSTVRIGTDNPPVLRRYNPEDPGDVTAVARLAKWAL